MIWYISFFFALYWFIDLCTYNIVEAGSSMIERTVAEKEDKFN
ncbi:hypothetical protein [Bacillus pumilus]